MTKNIVFIILSVVILALGYLFSRVFEATNSSRQEVSHNDPVISPATSPVTSAVAAKPSSSSGDPTPPNSTAKNEIASLRRQLEDERSVLALESERLKTLKNQQLQQTRQIEISVPLQISSNQSQIRDLSDELQAYHATEDDLKEQTKAQLEEWNRSAQMAQDQIDLSINSLAQYLQQIKEQIDILIQSPTSNPSETQARIQELQNLWNQQNEQLGKLRADRATISANLFLQTMAMNSFSQNQKIALIEDQRSIQSEIFALRQRIEQLRNDSARSQMSLMTLSERVKQAEQSYMSQLQKVKDLESRIHSDEIKR